jgi:two-component system sensor histidine kinase/response regulator
VIIALTANIMQGDEEKCINAGMNDYISKPVKLEEVVLKLEKWALQKTMTG